MSSLMLRVRVRSSSQAPASRRTLSVSIRYPVASRMYSRLFGRRKDRLERASTPQPEKINVDLAEAVGPRPAFPAAASLAAAN